VSVSDTIAAGTHTNKNFIKDGRFHGGQIAADIAAKLGDRC